MGIEDLLRVDEEIAHAQHVLDEADIARRVRASIDAAAVSIHVPVPGRPAPTDQPDTTGPEGEISRAGLSREVMRELADCQRQARDGDPSGARRVAELLELLGRDEDATTWWQVAAELGDPDAIDYVNVILTSNSPTPSPIQEAGESKRSSPQWIWAEHVCPYLGSLAALLAYMNVRA